MRYPSLPVILILQHARIQSMFTWECHTNIRFQFLYIFFYCRWSSPNLQYMSWLFSTMTKKCNLIQFRHEHWTCTLFVHCYFRGMTRLDDFLIVWIDVTPVLILQGNYLKISRSMSDKSQQNLCFKIIGSCFKSL